MFIFIYVYTIRRTIVRRPRRQALHASAAALLNMWPGDQQLYLNDGAACSPEWMVEPQSQSRPPGAAERWPVSQERPEENLAI